MGINLQVMHMPNHLYLVIHYSFFDFYGVDKTNKVGA